jgi:hypothetical protein
LNLIEISTTIEHIFWAQKDSSKQENSETREVLPFLRPLINNNETSNSQYSITYATTVKKRKECTNYGRNRNGQMPI